jgi:hypothetical protein
VVRRHAHYQLLWTAALAFLVAVYNIPYTWGCHRWVIMTSGIFHFQPPNPEDFFGQQVRDDEDPATLSGMVEFSGTLT